MAHRWRVLAIPYGSPGRKDKDGEYFSPDTDLGLALTRNTQVPVTIHHGQDPSVGRRFVGYASDWENAADGLWATVTVHDETIGRALASDPAPLFASSGAASHMVNKGKDGHILTWPLAELALTYSPINHDAVTRYLGDLTAEEERRLLQRLDRVEMTLQNVRRQVAAA